MKVSATLSEEDALLHPDTGFYLGSEVVPKAELNPHERRAR